MFTPENIRELRKRLGVSATVFAVKLSVTENTVRRWEMGVRHPSYEKLEELNRLAAKCGYRPEPVPA